MCLDVFQPLDAVTVVTCGHSFHWACVEPWLERNARCPCCRYTVRMSAYGAFPFVPITACFMLSIQRNLNSARVLVRFPATLLRLHHSNVVLSAFGPKAALPALCIRCLHTFVFLPKQYVGGERRDGFTTATLPICNRLENVYTVPAWRFAVHERFMSTQKAFDDRYPHKRLFFSFPGSLRHYCFFPFYLLHDWFPSQLPQCLTSKRQAGASMRRLTLL